MKNKIAGLAPIAVKILVSRGSAYKIATDSGRTGLDYIKCHAPNYFYAIKNRHFEGKKAGFGQKIVILHDS